MATQTKRVINVECEKRNSFRVQSFNTEKKHLITKPRASSLRSES